MDNPYHRANQHRWDAAAPAWGRMHDQRGDWRRCADDPTLVFVPAEMKHLEGLQDQAVAVLGSGDNLAVFALAGMGARVTSVDISQKQLDIADERAEELGLDIEFVHADVTDLPALADNSFDLVYTGGHVAVWVSDLQAYYREAVRILRPGGCLLVSEYHPFRRVWKKQPDRLEVGYDYYDRGPFVYQYDEDILHPKTGNWTAYEFHWTVSDMIRAVLRAGGRLIDIDEFGAHVGDWEGAPMQGLPEFLLLVAEKEKAAEKQ